MSGDQIKFLKKTLALASKGRGFVSPNPMVGALIAKENKILGTGYHRAFGLPHAEIEALKAAGQKARGATLYVNLEPCCVYGKTPPCTEAVIKAGIKEVICPMQDPNPMVKGKGFSILEQHGIKVSMGQIATLAEKFNRAYTVSIGQKRPYIILKWAETIDGKIAAETGDSKWITSEEARLFARQERFFYDGILVGIGTILKDNPFLDYTEPASSKKVLLERKQYFKIVLDPGLRTPTDANIWKREKSNVILVTSNNISEEKCYKYNEKKCIVIKVSEQDGKLSLKEILKHLYDMQVGILLVEGGSKVLTSFWENCFGDKAMIYIGNKLMGGGKSLCPISGKNIRNIGQAGYLGNINFKLFESDILISGDICFPE